MNNRNALWTDNDDELSNIIDSFLGGFIADLAMIIDSQDEEEREQRK